jgi:hypothetical protein
MIIGPLSKDIYSSVAEKLDEIEDCITCHCALKSFGAESALKKSEFEYSNPQQCIVIKFGEIVSLLSKKHAELFEC